uniref:Apple domain-containing protein n=1 Tax=Steinernema glaseri TaxID=37863 RepID=A0A1I8AU92_9BILA
MTIRSLAPLKTCLRFFSQDCVLTTVAGNSANIVPLSEEKSAAPINYYENECAKVPLPGAGVVEAKLQGYRGQGLVQLAQKKGGNPQIMVILNGVPENNNFDIVYVEEEVKDCYKLSAQQKASAQTLVTVDSDGNGMGVQPWTQIFFDIFDDGVMGKTVAVIDAKTKQVFDCGKIQVRGSTSDFEKAKNGAATLLFGAASLGIALLTAVL